MTLCSSAAGLFLPSIKHSGVFMLMAILETVCVCVCVGLFYLLFVWHLAGASTRRGCTLWFWANINLPIIIL